MYTSQSIATGWDEGVRPMNRVKAPGLVLSILWMAIAVVFLTWQPFTWIRGAAFVLFFALGVWGLLSAGRRHGRGQG